MDSAKPNILFVSHIADRSGAPLLLLEIVKAAVDSGRFTCSILCGVEGPLLTQFKAIAPTAVWKPKRMMPRNRYLARIYRYWEKWQQKRHEKNLLNEYRRQDIIFYNTIVNGSIQEKLSSVPARNICYVHELEAVIHMLVPAEQRQSVIKHTDHFFCVSEAVKLSLQEKFLLRPEILEVVPTPMGEDTMSRQFFSGFIQQFREKYGLKEATIVGIAAGNEWRKGFDLFVPLVSAFFRLYPEANVVFVWKGFKESITAFFDRFDLNRSSSASKIILLPHDSSGLQQIACFDIHLLLSREDPYPLVVLEAANFGVPTICFANAGGTPEFVGEEAGFSVPYLDLIGMCEKIHLLHANKVLREEMGVRAKKRLAEKHDKARSLEIILDRIEKVGAAG